MTDDLAARLEAVTAERDAARQAFDAVVKEHNAALAREALLREALEQSNLALNDWLHLYAADVCDEAEVSVAQARIRDGGGTIAYISGVQQQNSDALANPSPAADAGM